MEKIELRLAEFNGSPHPVKDVVPGLHRMVKLREKSRRGGKRRKIINCGVCIVDKTDVVDAGGHRLEGTGVGRAGGDIRMNVNCI